MVNKAKPWIVKFKDYALLHFSFIIYSFVAVLSKTAALQGILSVGFFTFTALELVLLAIYALMWQQCLKRFSLMKAYANKGIVVLWNLTWASVLFNERITLENLFGCAVIILGIMVVSSDEN
jgi:uncharacterized membrane protein